MSSTFQVHETKWHGARYYVVSHLIIGCDRLPFLVAWCIEQYGEMGDRFSPKCERYYMGDGKIFFRNQEDVTLFLLRWS